jgi:hypothetical protein
VLSVAMISMGRTSEKLGPALYSPECVEEERRRMKTVLLLGTVGMLALQVLLVGA